jgi:hypothetical protein
LKAAELTLNPVCSALVLEGTNVGMVRIELGVLVLTSPIYILSNVLFCCYPGKLGYGLAYDEV